MTTAPTAVAWHRGPLWSFDVESTGTNVDSDRIVTAALVRVGPDWPTQIRTWLSDADGVEIHPEAVKVHGISTERARAEGEPARKVIEEIATALADAFAEGGPVVLMNAPFDMTMLDRECRQHGIEPLDRPAPIIDVRVLDRHVDKWRAGGRKLTDLCRHYGVNLDLAHDAGGDALGALRVAYKLAAKFPQLQIDPADLHRHQVRLHAEQVADFAAYRRRKGEPLEDENGEWPVRSLR